MVVLQMDIKNKVWFMLERAVCDTATVGAPTRSFVALIFIEAFMLHVMGTIHGSLYIMVRDNTSRTRHVAAPVSPRFVKHKLRSQ